MYLGACRGTGGGGGGGEAVACMYYTCQCTLGRVRERGGGKIESVFLLIAMYQTVRQLY
jgi:hypothetical protein